MVDPIQAGGIQSLTGLGAAPMPTDPTKAPQSKFADYIYERLNEVNALQKEADQGVQKLLTGEADNYAEVFAASNKAGIAFDLLMEVRNKLVEAYREIQQMRV